MGSTNSHKLKHFITRYPELPDGWLTVNQISSILKFINPSNNLRMLAKMGLFEVRHKDIQKAFGVRPEIEYRVVRKPDTTKMKLCLRCRKPFPSEGRHNHICSICISQIKHS